MSTAVHQTSQDSQSHALRRLHFGKQSNGLVDLGIGWLLLEFSKRTPIENYTKTRRPPIRNKQAQQQQIAQEFVRDGVTCCGSMAAFITNTQGVQELHIVWQFKCNTLLYLILL